jgi:hypothetical protein
MFQLIDSKLWAVRCEKWFLSLVSLTMMKNERRGVNVHMPGPAYIGPSSIPSKYNSSQVCFEIGWWIFWWHVATLELVQSWRQAYRCTTCNDVKNSKWKCIFWLKTMGCAGVKNDSCLWWVLQWWKMKDGEWMFHDCLKGDIGLSVLVKKNTFSFAILYIITSCASVCLSSRLHQFKRP